ncbi:hypothetical protein, partial [Escherichia coli]
TFCGYFIIIISIGFSYNYWKCDQYHTYVGVYNVWLTFFMKSVSFCPRFRSEAGTWLCNHPKNKFVFLFNRREEKQGNLVKRSFDKLALALDFKFL